MTKQQELDRAKVQVILAIEDLETATQRLEVARLRFNNSGEVYKTAVADFLQEHYDDNQTK